jgi:hypothetical protein
MCTPHTLKYTRIAQKMAVQRGGSVSHHLSSSQLSITTYYRHSRRRCPPFFTGASLSYNGHAASYRHKLALYQHLCHQGQSSCLAWQGRNHDK